MTTNDGYPEFEKLIATKIAEISQSLFTTNTNPENLWTSYLNSLPANRRQHYNCNCCKKFIEKFGGLVVIDAEGYHEPLLWDADDGVPEFFLHAVAAVETIVGHSKVTGVFLFGEKEREFGVASTGSWTHLSGVVSKASCVDRLFTSSQKAAEKTQDYGILSHGIADYSIDVAREANRVLSQDALYRSEKASAIATWFLKLHESLAGLRGVRRENLIWAAVATAPPGFCHIRSTVVSTLYDDIKAGEIWGIE